MGQQNSGNRGTSSSSPPPQRVPPMPALASLRFGKLSKSFSRSCSSLRTRRRRLIMLLLPPTDLESSLGKSTVFPLARLSIRTANFTWLLYLVEKNSCFLAMFLANMMFVSFCQERVFCTRGDFGRPTLLEGCRPDFFPPRP